MDKRPEVFLTLERQLDGRFKVFVNGAELVGVFNTSVVSNVSQQSVEITLHSSAIEFRTAQNPHLGQLN